MRSISEYQYNKSNYTLQNILGQSLWYSRCCILSVSLMSGIGLPWNFDPAKVNEWLQVLDEDDIESIIPENITLLRAVYKKGDPCYHNIFDGNLNNYHNFLWDDSSFKRTINPVSQAYLIMDEVMLARYFYKCSNIEFDIKENLTQKKILALLLINSAIMQGEFMSDFLRDKNGLFVSKEDKSKDYSSIIKIEDEDNSPEAADQALAMKAFSMLADALDDTEYPLFKNTAHASMFKKYSDEIYYMFEDSPDDVFNSKARDLSTIISSCIEYYKLNPSDNLLNYITALSIELESRVDMSGNVLRFPGENDLTSGSSCFVVIRSLIEAFVLTNIYKFLNSAVIIYKKLNFSWDSTNSLYCLDSDDKYKYTLRDAGSVLSGINAIRVFGDDVSKGDAESKLISFFNSAINLSGLVQSCWPPPVINDCEGYINSVRNNCTGINESDFCHPDIPRSPGSCIAPVFAKKFTYKAKKHKFNVNSKSFYSDYALLAVYEMLCMNYPETQCFYHRKSSGQAETPDKDVNSGDISVGDK